MRRIQWSKAGFLTVVIIAALLIGCNPGAKITSVEPSYIEFSAETVPVADAEMTKLIEPYKSKLDKDMNVVLAQCEMDMDKANPEGLLGNFIADLTLTKANQYCNEVNLPLADISMLNNGGLRTSLIKGPIYKKRIYELMPFENEMVVLTISGEKMQGLFNYLARIGGMPVSGLTMLIIDSKPIDMMVGGEPFDINKTYRVATSDYLAEGGDRMRFFLDPIKRDNLVHKLRDAIIDYVSEQGEQGKVITAKLDGRISFRE